VARGLNNLSALRVLQNDWRGAAALCLRAKPIITGAGASRRAESDAPTKARLAQNTDSLRGCARILYHADGAANLGEGFALAQWALQNAAADALTFMSARFAKGDSWLARLVREVQDLADAREAALRQLNAAVGKADAKAAEATRAAIATIDERLAAKSAQLRRDFPEYASLANPRPLAVAEVQAHLGEEQALVLFLDLPQYGPMPEETLIFAVTAKEARWLSIPQGRAALRQQVGRLRCGLDSSDWRVGRARRTICKKMLGTEVSETELPPFDAATAHALYRDLFGGIEDLIKDKSLLIVPSGPLTQLPFQALVTREPDKSLPRFDAYKQAAWLGQRHAITVLPSVGSVAALRSARSSEATAPFTGFGNPLLTGEDGTDKRAWARQACSQAAPPRQGRVASLIGSIASLFRGGAVNVEELRRQAPLPETADELCAVASGLGVAPADLDKTVHLGSRATVTQVKALSATGELARARVVHFATHGLLAGETAMFARNRAEPALLMTPPAAEHANDDDNGLLTASEVAGLKLDADWVIMSACNTAAAAGENAEALSGLARAFFYAGARSLLVSHWYVNSNAAVAITTGAINAMRADPKIGRAEALRRSLAALIAKGVGWDHPSIWAPFVVVGNGGQ
jgi:CHAT domain-containing protein